MPEPRMAYITNRRLFENAFEIAAASLCVLAKISLKLSSKNKRLHLHGETVCRKQNEAKEIGKAVREKVYKNTGKSMNMVSEEHVTQWTNIQT